MNQPTLKRICVVEFCHESESKVTIYVPRSWITAYSGRIVTVLLPEDESASLVADPAILNKLPSCDWQQCVGKIIYETDSIEEAVQVVNLHKNAAKEENEMISSFAAVVTSVIKDISVGIQRIDEHGPSTSSGATNKLNSIILLEIIQPMVASLNSVISNVIRINRNNPVINEKLENIDKANTENILRLRTFSNHYTDFFQNVMNRHTCVLNENMKYTSGSADSVMTQNIKILNELMSTLLIVLCVLNGNIM